MNDILLTALEGDLLIKNGDFQIGFSDDQNIHDIISSNIGEYKQYPTVGVGIKQYQYAPTNVNDLTVKMKIQLKQDGFNVANPTVTLDANGKLQIYPNAIR